MFNNESQIIHGNSRFIHKLRDYVEHLPGINEVLGFFPSTAKIMMMILLGRRGREKGESLWVKGFI